MRKIEPARLLFRRAARGRRARYVILDQGREFRTGFGEGQREEAEDALAVYIVKSRKPNFGKGDPDKVLIAECLSIYCEKHGPNVANEDAFAHQIERLGDFFGNQRVSEICPTLCDAYVEWRCAQTDRRAKRSTGSKIKKSTAKRELVTLRAAINWCFRNKLDGMTILDRAVAVHTPKVTERRERFLTRSEVAALLWAALGFERVDGKIVRNKFRINRHLARFILIGLYTGSRHTTILRLQWLASTVGGWFDLVNYILYRRPQDAIETDKRRPPTVIPKRLRPHLHRWKRHSTQYVIEYDGQPVAGHLRRSWEGACKLAGFGPEVTPHILKHTCATLMLQAGKSTFTVAGVLGTSEEMIRKVYGHHAMAHLQAEVDDVWSRKGAR